MVVQYEGMLAEMQRVVAAGGLPFYLSAQNPNLPRSIVSLRDLILQTTFHTPERDAGNEPLMK
jgi:hypothetical protein